MTNRLTTWRKLIYAAMADKQDVSTIVYTTLSDDEWDTEFDNGYGGVRGCPFTLWTEDRVYFPICYDGAEWVGSAPRSPCNIALAHQGGG